MSATYLLVPPPLPIPLQGLVEAATTDPAARLILADWLEEAGDPRAHAVRAHTWEPVAAILARPVPLPDLPKEALAVIFDRSGAVMRGLSSQQRLEAFLRVNADGRKGAPALRERQAEVRNRLQAGPPGLRPTQQRERRQRRATSLLGFDRNERRARASGDDQFAVRVGDSCHEHVARLYTSKRASVVYGRGGQEGRDDDAYSKAYNARYGGARWQDAGARIVYADHPRHRGAGTIVIETARGREVCRVPLPPSAERQAITFVGLLDGDLWAVRRQIAGQTVLVRYGLGRRQNGVSNLVRTGISLQLPTGQWEHGESVEACRAEARRKVEAAQARATAANADGPAIRYAAHILGRYCPDLVEVTHEDRRRAGYCDAGAAAFLARHGLEGRDAVSAAELLALPGVADRVQSPIEQAALRLARTLASTPAATTDA